VAKGRKPAIGNLARPEGFLDDIVRPIIQKGARKVKNVAFTSNLPTNVRTPISRNARVIESKMKSKRSINYWNKSRKASAKLDKALDNESYRMANRYAKKADVTLAKSRAVVQNTSVRKAAKGARRRGGYR